MKYMKNGLGKNRIILGSLCAVFLAFSLYQVHISPSFTAMFQAANFGLCLLSVLLSSLGNEKNEKLFRWSGHILFLMGMIFSVPAVYIYAMGDDLLNLWTKLSLLGGTALEALSFFWAKRKRMQRGIFLESVLWISFSGSCFAFFCAVSSPRLLPYGAALLILSILKCLEKVPTTGEEKQACWKLWAKCGAALLILGSLVVLMQNPYVVSDMFSGLGKGPEFLYTNSEKVMDGQSETYLPGARWADTQGNPIQAHGGQIQRMPVPDGAGGKIEKYVWIGENKNSGHLGNSFAVYSSEDLHRWDFEGDVLKSVESIKQLREEPYFAELYQEYTDEQLEYVFGCINKNTVMERPKMLYNEKTDSYVIWFHSDDSTEKNTYKCDVGMAGIAVSDSPFGPFRFIGRYRLSQCPQNQLDCFPASKGEARDMNLFQDEDGTAYIVYTSENNKTLYISKLNEDYTGLCAPPEAAVYGKDYIRLFPGTMREAPVLLKGDNGRYYLMSSSTTGWMSNQARVWSADEIFGEWRNDGNPCEGKGAAVTFDTQSTSIFQREDGQWIYYGDRWNRTELADSRYVWLPVTYNNDRLTISWKEEWR